MGIYCEFSHCWKRRTRTYLYRPITLVSDLDPHSLPSCIELYRSSLSSDQSARLVAILILHIIEWREIVLGWYREIAAIESFAKIAFVAADGLVDGDQVRSRRKSPFDLQLLERCEDAWVNMSAAEDLLAKRHQIRD